MEEIFKSRLSVREQEEILYYMPHFSIYKKSHGRAKCYCTACHEYYSQNDYGINHNAIGSCPMCGAIVTCKAMGRSRKRYYKQKNFVICYADGENLALRCYAVGQEFESNETAPVHSYWETARYYLSPGKAVQYLPDYRDTWKIRKTAPEEPWFSSIPEFSDYAILHDEEIQKTFLRWHVSNLPKELTENQVKYLCRCAVHSNLEYIMKGGFWETGMKYLKRKLCCRINWKSDNLLEMLKLDKQERNLLAEHEGLYYDDYIYFRRYVYQGKNAEDTYQHWNLLDTSAKTLRDVREQTGLSGKETVHYIEKQTCGGQYYFYSRTWLDYLGECRELGYDLHDKAISMPGNLQAAHQRTTQLVQLLEKKHTRQRIIRQNKKRKKLLFTDEALGLEILLPKSVNEIKEEGRILSHCVGGYADRHLNGKLHILFLRRISDPETPYYTMEVSTKGKIVQCRGYKNNVIHVGGTPKPPEIEEFEAKYQKYLDSLYKEGEHSHE